MLLGPLRALSYALTHGVPSAILADCWARGTPWKASVPLVGVVKTVCQLATVALASVTMGQNLVALSVANIGAMLDRAGVMLFKSSAAGAFATNQLLYGFFGVMLVLNCARPHRCRAPEPTFMCPPAPISRAGRQHMCLVAASV